MLENPSVISDYFSTYGYLGILVGIALGGEILLLAAGALTSFGYMTIPGVVVFAVLGIILHDLIWYFLGRSGREISFLKRLGKKFINKESFKNLENKFNKHSIKTIIFMRFIYGFRAFLLLAAGFSKMKFSKFIFYDTLGSSIWAFASVLLGYFFGHSFSFLKTVLKELYFFIPSVLGICLVIILFMFFIKKKVAKKF